MLVSEKFNRWSCTPSLHTAPGAISFVFQTIARHHKVIFTTRKPDGRGRHKEVSFSKPDRITVDEP